MHSDKTPQNKGENTSAAQQGAGKAAIQLQDNRPRSVAQRNQLEVPENFAVNEAPVQKKANDTGLPDPLKSGIENLSGYSMDDVKVHYNSAKPAQLNAHAYAQGSDIHLASGQEKHLPHEAWHVVQQKQGRVKPTKQLKGKVSVNDDTGLEKEADSMGNKALQLMGSNMQPAKLNLKRSGVKNVKQFILGWDSLPVRWYEFDGTAYKPRTLGLASWTGWIKLKEQHEGKDAYISITNLGQHPDARKLLDGIEQVRNLVDEHTPLISTITQSLLGQEQVVTQVRQAQREIISFNRALGNYLVQTSTYLKLLGVVLGLTVSIGSVK